MSLVQRRRIIDALAALLTGKGVDHQVRRTHQTVLHRSRRLDRQQFGHQWLVEPTPKLGEHFREDEMLLGSRSTWTSRIPQAYITATSVRNRLQICSSAQDSSCFNSSKANNTRVATGGRPRLVGVGKRWANERSTAATRAAHGNVSAHWRRGCVSGTNSATEGKGHVRSANAGDIVRVASSALLIGGGREPQHTTI